VHKRPLKIVNDRQQVFDDLGFHGGTQTSDLFVVTAAQVGGIGPLALQCLSQLDKLRL
jgi:hypothetical protein